MTAEPMTDLPAPRPFYLDVRPDPVFVVYHAPADGSIAATAVLLCPPWGWDDVSSYRARRSWAEDLARAGHPTLRIDLPGTGDSGGAAGDPRRFEGATEAVAAAAAWLRASSGAERVAVVGLGFGGLVAAGAVAAGAPIDDLVLWAVPPTGRGFIRQLRAFASLQGSRYSVTGQPEPTLLPDGWMEVNGFVLSAATVTALASISLAELPVPGLQRALLLEQDGMTADPAVSRHLEQSGVEVTMRPGPGWGAMTFHPERPESPLEVFATLRGWLAEASSRIRPTRADGWVPAPSAVAEAELSVEGGLVRETPLFLDGPAGGLFGVLARPAANPGAPVCAIFLNAGAVRRIGPNRIWVEAARRWAAQGIPTLRVDLEGIGDSDGDADRYRDVGQFYIRDELGDQISAFVDTLIARGHGPRVILAGLCAGGYWAFQAALRDERVTAAFLLNPGALVWYPELTEARDAARLRRLVHLAWWGRLIRGQVRAERVREITEAAFARARRGVTRGASRLAGQRSGTVEATASPAAILDRLRDAGTNVVIAFSDDELLRDELERDGVLSQPDRWPNLRLEHLPGRDHTLRPIVAQLGVHALLDRELEGELARAVAAASARIA